MRGYQRRALAWMASREDNAVLPDQAGSSSRQPSGKSPANSEAAIWHGTLHPSWQRVLLPSGLPFYHNWMTGVLLLLNQK